ncbi:MAG: TonB-dependent receptor [Congregibacter sp.]
MTTPFKPRVLAAMVASISALTAVEAFSQTQLEEIVVTARQRAESIQDIPIAVTAFTEENFDRQAIRGMEDIARFTSGLNFEDFGGGFGTPVIRSASQTRLTAIEQNVATFWDGLYVPRGWAVDVGVSSLQRVEVVKGPQSARYGRNAFMGAINYVPRKPTEEFNAEVEVTAGIDDRLDYGGYLSGSLIEGKLLGQVSFNASEFDGSWDNVHPNAGLDFGSRGTTDNVGGWDNESWSASVEFRATDTLSFNAAYYQFDISEESRGASQIIESFVPADGGPGRTNCGPTGFFGTPRLFCGTLPSPPDKLAVDPRAYGRQAEVDMFKIGADWQISDALSLSYFFGNVDGSIDIASISEADQINCGTNFGAAGLCRFQNTPLGGLDYDQQEIRLRMDDGGPLSWSVGAFYSEGTDITRFAIPTVPALTADPLVQEPQIRNGETTTEVVSVFGELSYRFSEQLRLSIEARYTDEEITTLNNNNGLTLSDNFTNLVPRFSLEYQLNEDQMLYASAAEGVKSGGFNETATLAEDQVFDEERNWTFEIGSKNVFLDGALVVNAALFYISWEDIQLNAADSGATNPNAVNITLNLGNATSYGLELDGAWALSESFSVNWTASFTDATYDSGTIDNRFARVGPVFFPNPASCDDVLCPSNGDISGNDVERQAPVQLSFGAEWASRFDAIDADYYLRADVSYQSEREAESMNLAQLEARTITNATAGLSKDKWDLRLWVRNLTDEAYTSNSFAVLLPFGNGYGTIFGERRTAGVTASYRF